MNNKFKKIISIGLIILIVFGKLTLPGIVVAFEVPSAPTAPTAPTASSEPAPSEPSAPTAPTAPTYGDSSDEAGSSSDDNDEERNWDDNNNDEEEGQEEQSQSQETPENPTLSSESTNQGVTDSGNVGGDTTIGTGDATSTGTISNLANTNTTVSGCCEGGSASVSNTGNGSGSTNNGSVTLNNNSGTNQTNYATVVNDLDESAVSGDNEASSNVGGDSTITTGDSNVTGTILNSVNTNVDGVAVAEFNVVDDHTGDIILDFGDINCVAGCGSATATVENSGNGSDSENTGEITNINEDNTFQYNTADVENNMTLEALSGSNDASSNTGGDSTITTGDANVAATVANFVNNNIAGNVILGVINIFGDLIGDIILPDDPFASCSTCTATNASLSNTGNGSDSINNANYTELNTDNTFQYNDATIENNIIVDANTGGNSASSNTGGSSSITTGDADVDVNTLNIANSNLLGGDWWLVIVNEAGQWIGRIMGAPEGQNFAGSYGTEFVVDENGEITAMNTGNGEGSTNNANVTNVNTSNTTQMNDANVVNNLNLTANTGDNSTSRNTGGNNSIVTGDANIVANIVNFVNNNIAGNGRLFVTLINVFGSWTGDLVAPGQEKNTAQNTGGTGGVQNVTGSGSNNSNNTENNEDDSSSESNVAGVITTKTNKITYAAGTFGESADEPIANFFAGASNNGAPQIAEATKAITLNLAWLLLVLPFIGMYIIKRKFASIRGLVAKGVNLLL